MTNRFYNSTFNALPLTLIPSASHNSQYALVALGFDSLQTEIDASASALVVSLAAKAPLVSPALTGTPTAPTATTGTSTTQVASTAFVAASIAAVNEQTPATTVSIDSATSINASAGQHIVCTAVTAATVTLPAAPSVGHTVWVTPGNGLLTNVIARNGNNIMGLAEDLTINSKNVTVALRYINPTLGWRLV